MAFGMTLRSQRSLNEKVEGEQKQKQLNVSGITGMSIMKDVINFSQKSALRIDSQDKNAKEDQQQNKAPTFGQMFKMMRT